MIERISNHNITHTTRITSVEKANPIQPIKDLLENTEQQKEKSPKKIKKEEMEEVVQGINNFLHPVNSSIKFVLHDKLDEYYVNVVDDETNEVIKEIPSKKLLDTYAAMLEFVGILVDEKV